MPDSERTPNRRSEPTNLAKFRARKKAEEAERREAARPSGHPSETDIWVVDIVPPNRSRTVSPEDSSPFARLGNPDNLRGQTATRQTRREHLESVPPTQNAATIRASRAGKKLPSERQP